MISVSWKKIGMRIYVSLFSLRSYYHPCRPRECKYIYIYVYGVGAWTNSVAAEKLLFLFLDWINLMEWLNFQLFRCAQWPTQAIKLDWLWTFSVAILCATRMKLPGHRWHAMNISSFIHQFDNEWDCVCSTFITVSRVIRDWYIIQFIYCVRASATWLEIIINLVDGYLNFRWTVAWRQKVEMFSFPQLLQRDTENIIEKCRNSFLDCAPHSSELNVFCLIWNLFTDFCKRIADSLVRSSQQEWNNKKKVIEAYAYVHIESQFEIHAPSRSHREIVAARNRWNNKPLILLLGAENPYYK